jgi:hypothetical protein
MVSPIRGYVLKRAGHALVASDVVAPADVIVVPQWSADAGAIEAADMVHAGLANRVAVLPGPQKTADEELARRGIPFRDEAANLIELLERLGVRKIERIPIAASGTESEGEILPSWCDARGYRSMVVVSVPDHSRRVRRVLRRAMDGRAIRVAVRLARYSSFDPDRWWTNRDGVRTEIVESQKLLLDVVRHPF